MTTMNPYNHGGGGGISQQSSNQYTSGATTKSTNMSTHDANNHHHNVGFRAHTNKDDYQEERKKYLTAKYPQHQMRLIRKRLQVEDWVDTQLRELYDVVDDTDTYDCEIDIDELLDMESLSERRRFVQEQIVNVRKSPEVINQFIDELLEKASTL